MLASSGSPARISRRRRSGPGRTTCPFVETLVCMVRRSYPHRGQFRNTGLRLIAEQMTLREFRRARKLSQVRVAKELGIGQEGVSKIEKRADLMISTLRKTVEAMGGSIALVGQFSDSEPVILSGIAEDKPKNEPTGRKRAYAGA